MAVSRRGGCFFVHKKALCDGKELVFCRSYRWTGKLRPISELSVEHNNCKSVCEVKTSSTLCTPTSSSFVSPCGLGTREHSSRYHIYSGTESGKAGEASYGWAVYPTSQVLQMECVGNHFRPHMMHIVYHIILEMSISVETRKKIALYILIVILPIWKH